MTNYLIELSIVHSVLMLGYWIFLRKERQYGKMRFYLLGSTFLALVIPLLQLPNLFWSNNEPIPIAIPLEAITLDAMAVTPTETSNWQFGVLVGLYIAISAFLWFKFFQNVRYLVQLGQNTDSEFTKGSSIRKVRGIRGSFSFFNWIFLEEGMNKNQEEYQVILKHEKAHVSLGHSYDLIFFEVFKVCFWWLPTAWLNIKEIKKIHEYQADAAVLKSFDLDHYSNVLITSTLKMNGLVGLASSFHDGLILKRLKAMKQNAKNVSPWKWGVLSSIGALLLVVFACSDETGVVAQDAIPLKSVEKDVFTVVEELPQYPGGTEALYQYIGKNIKYPKQARTAGVEGTVEVQFVVEKDGSLSGFEILKGIGAGCDAQAIEVLQNVEAFKPGSQRGKKVRVLMSIPIVFKLQPEKTNTDNSTQGMVILKEIQQKNKKMKIDANYANGEWIGTIYDEKGNAMPGASIYISGASKGTVSDLDGTFKLKVDQSEDIHITYVGYESVRMTGK